MSLFFTPNGSLDLNTDPSDMPEDNGASGEMQRCKNLRLTEKGIAQTRDGLQAAISGISAPVNFIIEQAGTYYSSAGSALYQNSTSIATGISGSVMSGFLYNSYNSLTQNIFVLDGTNRKRIEGSSVYEWGIAPPATPTIATGASTGLTGDYNAKVTYCRKEGSVIVSESDPSSAAAAAVTLANGSLSVTWTASSDSQVTHVRVYRTAAGGSAYYHDQDVAVGTVTVDTTTADSALGTELATNHDRPPQGSFAIGPNFNGVSFIIKDNLLYWSLAKQPEYWPTSYYIEVSPRQQPGKCAVFWGGTLYYLSIAEIYLIQGTGANTFFPYKQSAITGTQGPLAVEAIAGDGIYHVGADGVYRFATSDAKITHGRYDRIFRGETVNDVPGVVRDSLAKSWLIHHQNKMYFGYSGSGDNYPTNVIVLDMVSKRSWYYKYPFEISCVAKDRTNGFLLAGGATTGKIYKMENPGNPTDDGTAIGWELESKDFTLQTRAHFPRWVKYDVNATNATATGKVVLDGNVQQTHTISGNRSTKRRLVNTGNGTRESLRVTGTGQVKIYGIEAE